MRYGFRILAELVEKQDQVLYCEISLQRQNESSAELSPEQKRSYTCKSGSQGKLLMKYVRNV